MNQQPLETIVLCGHGLAFETTLAALSETLPDNIEVIALDIIHPDNNDLFYGNITSPHAYDFHLSIGLNEPDLIYNTDTSFAYGTHYQNWANRLDWVQSYNLPFPIWQGVPFHHYLLQKDRSLQPLLIGSVCGLKDKFAHPPSDAHIALSRAEYGYQYRPASLSALLKKQTRPNNIRRKSGEIKRVHSQGHKLISIELMNGELLKGQLFIDATGPKAELMKSLENNFKLQRSLYISESVHDGAFKGSSLRKLSGETYGWKSVSPSKKGIIVQTLSHLTQKDQTEPIHLNALDYEAFSISTGRRSMGWKQNCVAIGQASYILEPLTPAPLMLLYKDIERLLTLIPHTSEMELERKEFNRLRDNDIEHCDIFQRAFFEIENPPQTAYWQDITARPASKKLNRKITQFTSRAYLTKFDLEPFNDEDWTILHLGMRRNSQRHIDYTDSLPDNIISKRLDELEKSIQFLSRKVPPHDMYVENFKRYLEKKM